MMNKKESPTAVIVNDSLAQLTLFANLLIKAGINALIFRDAEAAIASLNQDTPPDLIVTDLYMHGIDGWRFCRLLRSPEYKAFNRVPVMVVSATYTGEHIERITTDIGADAFLSVPVDANEFSSMARALIEGKKAHHLPRLLIIDADHNFSGLLKKAFTAYGYHVDTTFSVKEAETAISSCRYDAAIIDYNLPDTVDDSILDHILKTQPDCVCLIVTDNITAKQSLSWMKRGASAFLTKPSDPELIIEMCARARRERTMLYTEDLLQERTHDLVMSEKRHRELFETMSAGVVYQDAEGRIISANPISEKILGLTLDQMKGETSMNPRWKMITEDGKFVPGSEHPSMVALKTGKKTGPVKRGIYIPEKDKYKWLSITAIPLFEPGDEKPFQVYAIFDDITEQKHAEDAVHQQQERLEGILKGTNAGTWEWNIQTGEAILNERWADILGYTLEEISPVSIKTWEKFCHPDDLKAARALLEKHFNKELNYFEIETRMLHKKGHWVWVIDRGRVITWTPDGKPFMMMGTKQDISEKKHAEERIALLAQMTDIAPGSIIVHDFDGNTIYANKYASEMHGYSPEEFMTLNLKEIDTPESASLIEPRMKIVEEKGETSFEVKHLRKDGTTFPGHVHIKKIEWAGKPAILSITLDLTEKKEAEEKHEKLQEQFNQAQKMESIGRLAGGVAHDFNNMLNVIMGHADMALDAIKTDDPLHEDIEEIMKAAKRSADLTRQLLAFARKQTISPKVLDLNSTIEGTLKMLRRIIGEDIELIWKPASGIWPIMMDPSQVDQILANLCVNARDAITKGGNIIIETGKAVLDEEYCQNNEGYLPGEYILLTVSDNGCGMDKQTISHLFEPFFTTKKTGTGTGLGLATVFGAIKQNNGFINVYSELNIGTTFKIYIPRYAGKEIPVAEEKRPVRAIGGNECILLVEDEPAILRLTQRMLENMGYTVLVAGSPGEAITMAIEYTGHIDLLMTDVIMPEMNGHDLAKKIMTVYPDLKWLYMSGYTADVIAHHGVIEEGMNFIQKPFLVNDLAHKLREILIKE